MPPDNTVFLAITGNSRIRLDLDTEGDLYTWGVREAVTWGEDKCVQFTIGADFGLVKQSYNEFDSFNFSVSPPPGVTFSNLPSLPANFNIPTSRSLDPGLFMDGALPIGECFTLRAGSRADFVSTEFLHFGPNVDQGAYLDIVGQDALNRQNYFLWSAFATAEYKPREELTFSAGYGYAQRPPSLTELYAGGPFFGVIQNGFNAIYGNANLEQEKLHQFDIGARANYERFRAPAPMASSPLCTTTSPSILSSPRSSTRSPER